MTGDLKNFYEDEIRRFRSECREKTRKIESRFSDADIIILEEYGFFEGSTFPEDPNYTDDDLMLLGLSMAGRRLARDIVQYVCDMNRKIDPLKEKIKALEQLKLSADIEGESNGDSKFQLL